MGRAADAASSVVLSLLLSMAAASAAVGCEDSKRGAESPKSESPASVVDKRVEKPTMPGLQGRWKGPHTCLELYATGEFTLSLRTKGPKIALSGEVVQRAVGDEKVELDLRPARIRRSRWVSACRKSVTSAKWLDSQDVLGTAFTTTSTSTLRLELQVDGAIELCGERCELLAAVEPVLVGTWRAPALSTPSRPTGNWVPGQLLGLELQQPTPALWIGGEAGAFYVVYARESKRTQSGGRFELTLTPWNVSKRPPDKADPVSELALLGGRLVMDQPITLSAERTLGGIRVCRGPSHCAQLPAHYER